MRNSKTVLRVRNASDKIFPAISGDQRIANTVSIVGSGGFGFWVYFWSIGFLFMINHDWILTGFLETLFPPLIYGFGTSGKSSAY